MAKPTLTTNTSTVAIATGGVQKFTLEAGIPHGTRFYWIFGSVTGTAPGVNLGGMHFPLNPDLWTNITIASPNTVILAKSKATLDSSGRAQASFNIPKVTDTQAIGVVFNHAYLVYDAKNNFYMVSNPVPLKLVQ